MLFFTIIKTKMSARVALARIQLQRIQDLKARVNRGFVAMYAITPTTLFLNVHDTDMALASSLYIVGMGGLCHFFISMGISDELLDREKVLATECDAVKEPFDRHD